MANNAQVSPPLGNKHLVLHSPRASDIARRYLIGNGFDGALTMLGMVTLFLPVE